MVVFSTDILKYCDLESQYKCIMYLLYPYIWIQLKGKVHEITFLEIIYVSNKQGSYFLRQQEA